MKNDSKKSNCETEMLFDDREEGINLIPQALKELSDEELDKLFNETFNKTT